MATAIVGTVNEFDEKTDSWSNYIDRLEQFFIANEIESEQKQKAILLSSVGPRTYKLICNLTQPDKPSTKNFHTIVELVREHHSPRPSIIVQRFKFNTYMRQPQQSIRNYVAELKKLSEFCNFGNNLDEMLRDRLVCGVNDKNIQTKLLAEKNLTFSTALEIAQALELADENFNDLVQDSSDSSVYFMKRPNNVQSNPRNGPLKRPNNVQSNPRNDPPSVQANSHKHPQSYNSSNRPKPSSSGQPCFRCNSMHDPATCRHKDSKCFYCSKVGHLASACRLKQRYYNMSMNNQNNVLDNNDGDSDEEYVQLGLFALSSKTAPIRISLKVNDKDTSFVFDTGAALTVLNKADYCKNFDFPLSQSTKTLSTFTGERVNIIGQAEVDVSHRDVKTKLTIHVVDSTGPSLVGRDWIASLKLDLNTICNLNSGNSAEKDLKTLLHKYNSVFNDSPGCIKDVKVKLHVEPGAVPKFCRARTPPYAMRAGIEDELNRLQRENIITPVEHSEWATPIVPILKKDKSVRICGDYKTTVNRVSPGDCHPIPLVEDLAQSLAGGEKYSKIDFSHAYTQCELDDQSKNLTVINTHKGLFRYNRLCFGVSAAPGIFQRTIESMFKHVPFTVNFIDDLYVSGENDTDHLNNLQQVLQICKDKGLTIKAEKCAFLQTEVNFLGYKLSKHGLKPMEDKVQAVKEFASPTDKHLLKSFLGLINYYGKFVNNLATTLAPLYHLLRKDVQWSWGKKEQKAFEKAKSVLSSEMILAQYDPNKDTIVTVDASPVGVGAILSQVHGDGERPVAFASRTLQDAERNYSQLDKEALAIIFAIKKWHKYLSGRHFKIYTDHKPLLGLLGEGKRIPEHASARVQRWAVILSAHSYTLEFKSGVTNEADVLSRLPLPDKNATEFVPAELEDLFTLIEKTPISVTDIAHETMKDKIFRETYNKVKYGWNGAISEELRPFAARKNELSVENGCLLWGVRVIIPPGLRRRVLDILHDSHVGMARMKAQARAWVWWPGMDLDIETMVRTCHICQVHMKTPPKAPLFPWEWPEHPWSRVHLDFAGPFLGKQFLIIVDAHSKWVDVKVMSSITAEKTILELRDVFSTLGLCSEIVTDNGPTFTSSEFRNFLGYNGVKHITVSPYHPSSNGLAERYVQEFKAHMTKNALGSIRERVLKFLTKVRSLPHCTTGLSPFELMFNRKMRTHLDLMHPNLFNTIANKQNVQKLYHDKHARMREVDIGDDVFVKNFSGKGNEWVQGTVIQKSGPYSYRVNTPNGPVRRHLDHVRVSHAESPSRSPEKESVTKAPCVGAEELATAEHTGHTETELDCNPELVSDLDSELQQNGDSELDAQTDTESVALRRSRRNKKPVDRLDL